MPARKRKHTAKSTPTDTQPVASPSTQPSVTPSPLPLPHIPCLFTIDQFQQSEHATTAISNSATLNQPAKTQHVYTVRPQAIWERLERYRECIVNDKSYYLNSTILLHPLSPSPYALTPNLPFPAATSSSPHHHQPRIARILEIRGFNQLHVYLRVFYLVPAREFMEVEDVEGKEGEELVATNLMGVVRAGDVLGGVSVRRLIGDGAKDGEGEEGGKGYWWREGWDAASGRLLSGGEWI